MSLRRYPIRARIQFYASVLFTIPPLIWLGTHAALFVTCFILLAQSKNKYHLMRHWHDTWYLMKQYALLMNIWIHNSQALPFFTQFFPLIAVPLAAALIIAWRSLLLWTYWRQRYVPSIY